MNKRISTLLAAALVAGGLSAQVQATVNPDNFKTGDYVLLKHTDAGTSSSKAAYITMEGGLLKAVSADPASLSDYNAALFEVTKTKHTSAAGVFYTYKFVNKEGKTLLLDLKTAPATPAAAGAASISAEVATISSTGNAEWLFDDAYGFYALGAKDSVFFLTVDMKLGAVGKKGDAGWADNSGKFQVTALKETDKASLSIADFNALLENSSGKLFFNNGKDVTAGEANVIKDSKWKAIGYKEGAETGTTFYLANGKVASEKVSHANGGSRPYLLQVDTLYNDVPGKAHFKLVADTLAADPAQVADVSGLAPYVKSKGTGTDKINLGSTRPAGSAQFSAVWYAANDSIVLTVAGVPQAQTTGNFWDGNDTPMQAATNAAHQVAIRQLSNTKVLTVALVANINDFIAPLIQPYAIRPVGGGTADIDVTKVYYVKDLNTQEGKEKNPTYGLFKNYHPVAETSDRLTEGQPFNPYCQFVFTKTPGTTKGSYSMSVRGKAGKITSGEDYFTLGGDSILVEGDTLLLVDAKIKYTGKESYLGYKHVSAYDLKNKAFLISSASPFMKEMYFHVQKDSTLKLAEGEVKFKLHLVDTQKHGSLVAGIDTLLRETYNIYTDKEEVLVLNKANQFVLTKDYDQEAILSDQFYFIVGNAADNYVLVPHDKPGAEPRVLWEKKMLVNTQTASLVPAGDESAKNDYFFVKAEADPASLFTNPKHATLKLSNGDMLAVGKDNFAVAARVGDLKAAYNEADFSLFIDTARYTDNEGKDLVVPSYYITKGKQAIPTAATAQRLYLWVAADSAAVDAKKYQYDGKTRLQFRSAERYGADSLIVANAAKNDTVNPAKGNLNNFRFNILVDRANAGSYIVRVNDGSEYLQSVNGTIVATDKMADAARITVNNAPAPVGNEAIDATAVQVVAGEGAVTVIGAAGKQVTVSDVLGRVAIVQITADSQTIAVAPGVAIVAVEGEAAVKAIVR